MKGGKKKKKKKCDGQANFPEVGYRGGCLWSSANPQSGAEAQGQGQDHGRQVHDRARHLGLEPDQDRNRRRPLRDRRSLLGIGRQGPRPQQAEADRRGRGSAQRRQALHEDADAERRRGRDRGRHRDGRQRHRDRAVGSRRTHPERRSAICSAGGSATASASIARCRPSSAWKIWRPGAIRCAQAKAEKFGWTAFKFQGDGIPPKADPEYKEPGHDRYTRG